MKQTIATYVATSYDTVRPTCIFELGALQQKTQKDSFEYNLDNSYEMPTDLIPRSNLSGLIPGGSITSASIRQGFIKYRRKANTRKNFSKHMLIKVIYKWSCWLEVVIITESESYLPQ